MFSIATVGYGMIAVGSLGLLRYVKLPKADYRRTIRTWYNVLDGAGIKNKLEDTFKITELEKTDWGFKARIQIPNGLAYEDLQKLNAKLDTAYSAIVDIRKGRFDQEAKVNIVLKNFADIVYSPVKTKSANFILCGYDYMGEPILIDMNTFPHVLIGGSTGTGKTRSIFVILTNLVSNHDKNELELYLCQVAKRDLRHFKDTENCLAYAKNMPQTIKMLDMLVKKVHEREKLFEKCDVENIEEYNKKYPEKKLPYCYVIGDEVSFYMPDNTDTAPMKKQKQQALDYFKQLIKLARASGIFVVLATQKTSTDNMPSTVKNQTNTKISYRQTTTQSSINIIEDTKAVGLPIREAIVYTNDYIYMKTPFIDKDIMQEAIKHRIKDHEYIDLEDTQVSETVHNEDSFGDNSNVNNLGIVQE